MILVDSNILMYAAGAKHGHKAPSAAFLERVARGEVEAALDAQTLQEVLHRYRSINRWRDGRRVYDLARQIFTVVIPIDIDTLDRARALMDTLPSLMARDALHAAVVYQHDLQAICSYDTDFDQVPSLKRIEP